MYELARVMSCMYELVRDLDCFSSRFNTCYVLGIEREREEKEGREGST
jgi:hypothetical protein